MTDKNNDIKIKSERQPRKRRKKSIDKEALASALKRNVQRRKVAKVVEE